MFNVKLLEGFKKILSFGVIVSQSIIGSFFSYLFYFFFTHGSVFSSKKSAFYSLISIFGFLGLSIFGVKYFEISNFITKSFCFYHFICLGVALIELIALYTNKVISQKQRAVLSYFIFFYFSVFIFSNFVVNASNALASRSNINFVVAVLMHVSVATILAILTFIILKLLAKFVKSNFKAVGVNNIRYGILYWLLFLSLINIIYITQYLNFAN